MLQLLRCEDQVGALLVVAAEVADPVLAEDVLAKAKAPGFVFALVAFVVLLELALEPLERMRSRAQSDHWFAGVQVVLDVLHLVVGKVLEAQEHHHQVRGSEGFETGDVAAAWINGAGLWVGGHQECALEAEALRQDATLTFCMHVWLSVRVSVCVCYDVWWAERLGRGS